MFQLRFLVSLIPILLCSCWDFAMLTDKGARDGGSTIDMYMCGTERNANREDCSNGTDDNQDCLVDCEDPQCKDAIRCVDPTGQLLGYGTLNAMTATCGPNQTTTDVKQDLSLSAGCTGCACQANTTWQCRTSLHWGDMAQCMNDMYAGNAMNFTSGLTGTTCTTTTMADPVQASYFKLDAITSVCPPDTNVSGTPQVNWGTQEKLCSVKGTCDTLDCVQRAGHKCLAFNGDFATCPAAFPNKINTWFKGVTDNRVCTCSCSAGGNSCTIAGSEAQVTDSATCTTGGGARTFNITQTAACVQPNLGGGAAVRAIAFSARPACAPSGTAPTDLPAEMSAGRVTLNGPVTTCCAP
jgi:hypothetical protein